MNLQCIFHEHYFVCTDYLIKNNFKKRRNQKDRILNMPGETAGENKMPEGSRRSRGTLGFLDSSSDVSKPKPSWGRGDRMGKLDVYQL